MNYMKIFLYSQLIICLALLSFFDLLVIANGIFKIVLKTNPPIDKDTKILGSSNTSNSNSEVHNSTLISILLKYLAIDANQLSQQKNSIIQIRLFYAAILTGLVSYLFSSNNPLIALFILFLILIMYLLEVHFNDLINRSEIGYFIMRKAVERLINLKPKNNKWYILNFKSLLKQQENASNHRWRRKFFSACNPNIEQIIFYCIPWLGISLYLIYLIIIK